MAVQPMVRSGYVPVTGGRLYYEMAGKGTTVVFIHAGIADCRMWDDQFDFLAQSCRVIRFDARGYGKSQTEAVNFSNRQDILDLMDYLGLEPCVLVGSSRGGQIAIDFTLEHPCRVRALVLVNSGLGGMVTPETSAAGFERDLFIEMKALWENREFSKLVEKEIQMFVAGPWQSLDRVRSDVREKVREMQLSNYSRRNRQANPMVMNPPAMDRLDEIETPTLVLVGDLDIQYTMTAADYMASLIPTATKVIIPGTAHLPNLEQPEKFNRLLLDFVEKLKA